MIKSFWNTNHIAKGYRFDTEAQPLPDTRQPPLALARALSWASRARGQEGTPPRTHPNAGTHAKALNLVQKLAGKKKRKRNVPAAANECQPAAWITVIFYPNLLRDVISALMLPSNSLM